MVGTVDVLLGNLEDGVKADRKIAAREGLVRLGESVDFGPTQFWTRLNSLDSPWFLDDVTTLVPAIGAKLDVVMVPKVEGAEDIHYVDRLLAQLEAKAGLSRPILVHAILETARGVANVEEICHGVAADAGPVARPGRPRRLPADEDDARRRRPPGLRRPRRPHPRRPRRAAGGRAAGPLALHRRADGRRVRRWPGSTRTTGRSATSATRSAARTSSAPPSCSAVSGPGRCTRARSPSPSGSSAPPRRTWRTPAAWSPPWATGPARSCSTAGWRTTPASSSAASSSTSPSASRRSTRSWPRRIGGARLVSDVRPRRSVLYLPASNERALEKAKTLPVDALILDLEDAVAPDAKVPARELACAAAVSGAYGMRELTIRVNGLGSPWHDDDLAAVCAAGPDGIVVPKVSTGGRGAVAGAQRWRRPGRPSRRRSGRWSRRRRRCWTARPSGRRPPG